MEFTFALEFTFPSQLLLRIKLLCSQMPIMIERLLYYAYSYAKIDYSCFMNVTMKIALHLFPESLKSQPVFVCIDDTMVSGSMIKAHILLFLSKTS